MMTYTIHTYKHGIFLLFYGWLPNTFFSLGKNTNSLVARLEANAKTDARPKEGLNKTPQWPISFANGGVVENSL